MIPTYSENPVYSAVRESRFVKLSNIPTLELGTRTGTTDYIDFIEHQDMTHGVMKGIDVYNRPFLAFKLLAVSEVDETIKFDLVGTFFQRYTDDAVSWAYGTCYATHSLYIDSRIRPQHHEQLKARLVSLLNGGSVKNILMCADEKVDMLEGTGKYRLTLYETTPEDKAL